MYITGVPQGDVVAPLLFIILVDYHWGKTLRLDSKIVTCLYWSRRYASKLLNDLDFADDVAPLEFSNSTGSALALQDHWHTHTHTPDLVCTHNVCNICCPLINVPYPFHHQKYYFHPKLSILQTMWYVLFLNSKVIHVVCDSKKVWFPHISNW